MRNTDNPAKPLTQGVVSEIAPDTLDSGSPPCCSDLDEDCEGVEDKLHCFLYDPQRGYCPYLRSGERSAK